MSAFVPVRLQQRMHDTTDVKTAARIREEFLQLHPEVRKVWEDRGPLTERDFSNLEEHVLGRLFASPGVRHCSQCHARINEDQLYCALCGGTNTNWPEKDDAK